MRRGRESPAVRVVIVILSFSTPPDDKKLKIKNVIPDLTCDYYWEGDDNIWDETYLPC